MEEKKTILYVDDESINLVHFKIIFKKDFDVITALSVDEGLEILKNKKIDILFSDQKMPDKSGTDLFEEIKGKYKNTYKAIITGYINNTDVSSALQKGIIDDVYYKPFEPEEVLKNIDSFF